MPTPLLVLLFWFTWIDCFHHLAFLLILFTQAQCCTFRFCFSDSSNNSPKSLRLLSQLKCQLYFTGDQMRMRDTLDKNKRELLFIQIQASSTSSTPMPLLSLRNWVVSWVVVLSGRNQVWIPQLRCFQHHLMSRLGTNKGRQPNLWLSWTDRTTVLKGANWAIVRRVFRATTLKGDGLTPLRFLDYQDDDGSTWS